jgi:hypothetical protein
MAARRRFPPLDEETARRVHSSLNYARWHGESIPERLHKDGLLWTPDKAREVQVSTLQFILEEVQRWQPHEFLRKVKRDGGQATPTDMYMAMCQWLEEHVAHVRSST